MLLTRKDSLNWTFIVRSRNPFNDFEFQTASLYAVLQILFPEVQPLNGHINFQQFENNDVIGALLTFDDPSVVSILKFHCIRILEQHVSISKWSFLLRSFNKTNCIQFFISGRETNVNRLFQLQLKILFSKHFTTNFKTEKFVFKTFKW